MNETHDPKLRSWVESANSPDTDFPIQNLPFGVFKLKGSPENGRVGVAIGEMILDVAHASTHGVFKGIALDAAQCCHEPTLNHLMAMGREASSELRAQISKFLADKSNESKSHCLIPMKDAEMLLPSKIGDYTDFYASVYHATNVGKLFRPDNPLLPNYKHVPIGYHGRASSIVVSGTDVKRPHGQTKAPDAELPAFGPSKSLDYECEIGFFVSQGNKLGDTISIDKAQEHIFGFCLVNDWSARDIQAWEYQPLGPFLAKNFATSISPWVVTMEALEPFRSRGYERPEGDPSPLPYLVQPGSKDKETISINVEIWLSTRVMREKGNATTPPVRLSRSNLNQLYWTPAQMLAHHASNGCNMQPGDLLASGTISGPTLDSLGCMLEITRRGAEPVNLPSGESRKFLEDGDEVIMKAYCANNNFRNIGFGECRGVVIP